MGILGVRRLLAIAVCAQALDLTHPRWDALLQSTSEIALGHWALGAGPELHLVPGKPHGAVLY